jgi:opacity protein-like surface antigen
MRTRTTKTFHGEYVVKKLLAGSVALLAIVVAGRAGAADLPMAPAYAPPPPPTLWSWTGFYLGGHVGAAMSLANINDPSGPSIFGDIVHSPGLLGGGQIGVNWQAPGTDWVFGFEADASFADLDGTNTCYAFSGTFTSFNCRAHTDALGTFTGRVGFAFGPEDRSLAYVKAGGAWAHDQVSMIVNNDIAGIVNGNVAISTYTALGWTFGAGAEYAMTPHWTVKAEFDYLGFGSHGVTAPTPSVITPTGGGAETLVSVFGTTVSQSIQEFKLGVNYKFGPDGNFRDPGWSWPAAAAASYAAADPRFAAPVAAPMRASGWEVEGGGRYWLSSGRFQKDVAPGNVGAQNPTLNISRLTWSGLTANSGELFARVDTPWNIFIKGFAGGGTIANGQVNDEDWGLPAAVNTGYSNTQGNASGTLGYGTVDVGFDVFRGATFKTGPFVGYNIYTENKSSTSCSQIALPASGICSPPVSGVFILSENDTWQSLRVGVNAEVMLTPQVKLVGDVAVLPYVYFTGQDDHPQRPFLAEESGHGIGTQAEAFLQYYVTPQFSIGLGGRYWAMWTTSGTDCREAPDGAPQACPTALQNMRYKTERYGGLLQVSYKFNQPEALANR